MYSENIDQKGNRIREERLRLGLSQGDFAALFDKKVMAAHRYEKGERVMTHDDLEKLHKAGVDVYYLITGSRVSNILTNDEYKILELYRACDDSQQPTLIKLVENFVGSYPKK